MWIEEESTALRTRVTCYYRYVKIGERDGISYYTGRLDGFTVAYWLERSTGLEEFYYV